MDDLISRKALDREMSTQLVHAGFKSYSEAGQMYLKAKQIVRSSPAIDAAPVVRGEWIELHEENGHEVGTCSHCRHVRIVDNYCPNCGAKMNGGNDNG